MHVKIIVTVLILICVFEFSYSQDNEFGALQSQKQTMRSIPVGGPVIRGDFADPSIIRVKDQYYATGTSSEWAPYFPIYKSKDLANWKQVGFIFQDKPDWAESSFWAPELFYHNGKYLLYYVAKRKSDGLSCIGVAVSDHPEKPFRDKGVLLQYGREAIDPFVFLDDGELYLTWKAYGLDKRPIEILASKLTNDGLKVQGDAFSLLRDDSHTLMEGQCLVKENGFYYIFYATGGCCGLKCSYAVHVARSKTFKGPYQIHEKPVIAEENDWKCPGHGTVVQSSDHKYYFMYHAFNKQDHVFTGRQGMIKQLSWTEDYWPKFNDLGGQNSFNPKQVEDSFDSDSLSLIWQWDLKFPKPSIKIKDSRLSLNGNNIPANKIGSAIAIRPESGKYSLVTKVDNFNSALKGLVIYGDENNSVGIGVEGFQIKVWLVRLGVRTVLAQVDTKEPRALLKIESIEPGKFTFHYSEGNNSWRKMILGATGVLDGSFLPPWDRSARVGLIQYGPSSMPAVFSIFKVIYDMQ